MASIRQVEANRRNAALSTGPSSESGKSRSRSNATKHGLAGAEPGVEADRSPAFERRLAEWGDETPTAGPAGRWALERAVAASLQIERCERALEGAIDHQRARAQLSWGEDRAAEAASLASRLAEDPPRVAARLETGRAGAELLLRRWVELDEALAGGDDWSDAQRGQALDLLGVPAEGRPSRTLADTPDDDDPIAYRRALAAREVARLQNLLDEALIPLDEFERNQAERGDSTLLSRPGKLVLRYERDAWRRYREAMKQVRDPEPLPTASPAPAPAPAVAPTPELAPPGSSPAGTKPMVKCAREGDLGRVAPASLPPTSPIMGVGPSRVPDQGASRTIVQAPSGVLR